ncbi:MAG: chemotaxis protein CheW [Bacillota bacterium]
MILDKEECGIEIRHVTEIVGIQNITEVPDMPPRVKGVINLRGRVIPVMDVRLRSGIEDRTYDDRTCIVTVSIDEHTVGLIINRVSEVLDLPKDDIEPPPRVSKGKSSRFIQAMGKAGEEVKILLNADRVLYEEWESDWREAV